MQAWWLDVVCGANNWDVALETQDDKVVAALPYYHYRQQVLALPRLSQEFGPWIQYPDGQKNYSRRSHEKKMIAGLLAQLPAYKKATFQLPYVLQNWLPFSWHGYTSTLRYTYILDDIADTDLIWKGFRENIRREIRKAESMLTVEESTDVATLHALQTKTFSRQQSNAPHSLEFLQTLFEAAQKQGAGKLYVAKDADDTPHAAIFVVYDRNMAYYIVGGADTAKRTSGAKSLLLWHAIQDMAKEGVPTFNFEGSMIEPIERFFSAFGGTQQPYIRVTYRKPTFVRRLLNKLI